MMMANHPLSLYSSLSPFVATTVLKVIFLWGFSVWFCWGMEWFADVVLVCVHFVVVLRPQWLYCWLTCIVPPPSLTNVLSLSLMCSLSFLWFVVVFTLFVFSSLTMASIWIDRAVVSLRSFFVLFSCIVPRTLSTIPCFRPDLHVLLFVHDLDLCILVLYTVMYYKTSNFKHF
jgi:hypothetical protein